MSVVSNFFRGHDPPPERDTAAITCRPARRDETHTALRLILGRRGRAAGDAEVLDFLRLAVQRRIDVNAIWLAERRGRVVWAVLPIVSPGRTMLLLCPGGDREPDAARQLMQAVCAHHGQAGIHLAQVLMEPDDQPAAGRMNDCGFAPLAELVYMQRSVPRALGQYELPSPLRAVSYSPAEHERFAATILASYDRSLDCPGLNGLRDIEDIVAGHRATGVFDPGLWSLLLEGERPLGVSLLARVPWADACELVYFGLVPEARGRGLGHIALQHTLGQLARTDLSRLTLAVDARNAPALNLYARHGLKRIGAKLAFLRNLRS